MLLTILIAWFLLAVPVCVLMGRCISVGLGNAEGATVRRLELDSATPENGVQPIAAWTRGRRTGTRADAPAAV